VTTDPEWRARLEAAVDALGQSADVPDWLKWAVRDALAVGQELAPLADAPATPPDFVYPH
jgi:hypothetical protein